MDLNRALEVMDRIAARTTDDEEREVLREARERLVVPSRMVVPGEEQPMSARMLSADEYTEATVYKDAGTGHFVSKDYADENPKTTYAQTVLVPKSR